MSRYSTALVIACCAALSSIEAAGYVVEDVRIQVAPTRSVFAEDEPAQLAVTLVNTAREDRYLGVSTVADHERAQKKTVLRTGEVVSEVDGVPGYFHIGHFSAYRIRIAGGGYSDHFRGTPLRLAPRSKTTYRIDIPSIDNTGVERWTGRFRVFSRFAISRTADGDRTLANGPETSFLVVDRADLAESVAVIEDALAGASKKLHEVESAVRTVADNPLPEYAGLIADAIRHPWPFEHRFDWTLWHAGRNFVAPEIYEAAVREAKRPAIGTSYAALVYETIYRNRAFLRHADILEVVGNPRLTEAAFTSDRNAPRNGFYATVLLGLVAERTDMRLLAEMFARFIVVGVEHDLCHATIVNRRLVHVHEAFSRHPDASRDALRAILPLGLEPGGYEPWARDFLGGRIPHPLAFSAESLAATKDTASVPILEQYANSTTVRSIQTEVPSLLAQIDGPEAMKALRRLGPRTIRERATLGDPAAVDSLLGDGRLWFDRNHCGRIDTNAGDFELVYSILHPDEEPWALEPDGPGILAEWKARREEFVAAFIDKYGFHPDLIP